MNSYRILFTVVATGLVALGLRASLSGANVDTQGAGVLAQAPLSLGGEGVPPAFVMTVDDSRSMAFQTLFPGPDGAVCFGSDDGRTFGIFSSATMPRATGACDYYYVMAGNRARDSGGVVVSAWRILPPLDSFGAARSPDFNPAYFDPNVTYEPWLAASVPPAKLPYDYSLLNPKGNASVSATKVDPRNADTVNLAADRYSTADIFTVRDGMFLPAGTKVRVVGAASDVAIGSGGMIWRGGVAEVYMQYYPATFYMRTTTAAARQPQGYKANARQVIANACGAGCDLWKYTIASANFDSAANYNAMLQNFANWFSYYGNRNRAMIAGMTRAMADVRNLRVGYFTINSFASYDDPATERVAMRDMSVLDDRRALYTSMLSLQASDTAQGTPNLQAVSAAAGQFVRTDAATGNSRGAPVQRACQKNAVMLFTDGYTNISTITPATPGNVDGKMGAPFQDGYSNTMADIVSRYYLDVANGGVVPLRSDGGFALAGSAGQVPVPEECASASPSKKLDCERRLHLNFYGITLGARGTLFDPDQPKDPFAENPTWAGWQDGTPSTVDDIWHATINTRGEYVNAKAPADITAALRRVLAAVSTGASPSGSAGLSGARISSNSLSVEPFYESRNNGTDWYGRLRGSTVGVDKDGQVFSTRKWDAGENLPRTGRNLLFAASTGGGVNPTVRAFTAANLKSAFAQLCSDALAVCSELSATLLGVSEAEAVAYLAGQDSGEKKNGGKLRDRTTRLGDIVNSSPVVSAPTDNYGFTSLRGAKSSDYDPYDYAAYLKQKSTRPTMVYVGANDGMLHGFRGDSGAETFGFIPDTSLGHMGNLLFPYDPGRKGDQIFQHRYFVDGPVTVSDAYAGSAWKTVLVGTAGAGGRGAFALDVTDPNSFSSGSVLWELNDKVSGAVGEQIGHVLGKPLIAPVRTAAGTQWKAIFGNGYGSRNGKASLFVVDLATGAASTIEVAETAGPDVPTDPNGLGNVVLLDRYSYDGSKFVSGSDGYVDTVYGGDLHGNIWKFDLRTNTPALGAGQPLFTAKDAAGKRQPITGALNAVAGPSNGVMVLFGTGSYSFGGDADNKDMQSAYGVVDRGVRITGARDTVLQQQVLSNDNSDGIREVTQNSVNFTGKSGWFLDLAVKTGTAAPVQAGERMVGRPRVQGGTFFFPTFEPTTTGSKNQALAGCVTGGTNWLYGLSALSGSAYMDSVRAGSPTATPSPAGSGAFELKSDSKGPITDVDVMSAPPLSPLGEGATEDDIKARLAAQGLQCMRIVKAAGGPPLYKGGMCGRQSWRQVR